MKTWTVEYMVRERKGDYLAAVEDLEASHKATVKALRRIAKYMDEQITIGLWAQEDVEELLEQAQVALKGEAS